MLDEHNYLCYSVSMEIRELKYFLAVAREQNLSRAAEAAFTTQPNITRQMQKLEKEIGQPLFVRGRKITLTETGQLLYRRAEEIVELLDRTHAELSAPTTDITGEVYIGGGESYANSVIAGATKAVRTDYPNIRFHFFSGDTIEVAERLDKGLIDFGIMIEPADLSKYEYVRLPLTDTWGVLMRKDSPLAEREYIIPENLSDLPLILSKHSVGKSMIGEWLGQSPEQLNIAATYNLIFNASLLVEAGIGYAIGLDGLINTSGGNLCFRPLYPKFETHIDLAWKRYRTFSKPAQIFLQYFKTELLKKATK